MESPVVLDKPPEYHDRGFPFDEEDGAGGWSELAARHPDIAARLRQRPATWARKRRPSSQDATDDFGDNFSGFERFPFDDIPPEFREHFPSHWNRRFGSREETEPQQTQASPPPPQQQQQPQQSTAATQTEHDPQPTEHTTLPQYGLRNTVDLGVKSPADPSVVDDERNQRCMSAPPDAPRTQHTQQHAQHASTQHNMNPPNQEQPPQQPHAESHSNVRHIPIFVEGRDEPVINKSVDHGTHFGESKPAYQPPPPQPHIDRDQYFADDGPVNFHHPPNFSRAFGTPFNKGFRQGPQPFTQQKAYPQNAFTRGASPQRSQSPRPPPHDEHFVKVPVHHENAPPRTDPPPAARPPPPHKAAPPQAPHQPSPQREQAPPQPQPQPAPKPQQPCANDPITQILSIQTDVLNLMTEVENFTGAKNDKRYLFLDEMLTRNLIKLDNIETEGKENIRQARKEAIRCIQKCIAVLEAKAESNKVAKERQAQAQAQDVDMKENNEKQAEVTPSTENGEVDKKEESTELQTQEQQQPPAEEKKEVPPKPQEISQEQKTETPADNKETTQPPVTDAPSNTQQKQDTSTDKPDEQYVKVDNKPSPKKKVVKKNRDKSASKDNKGEDAKDSNKKDENVEVMQVDDKGDKSDSQVMDVDGGASQ